MTQLTEDIADRDGASLVLPVALGLHGDLLYKRLDYPPLGTPVVETSTSFPSPYRRVSGTPSACESCR